VYFGHGFYDPNSSSGQRLLSHELTHVAQQGLSSHGANPAGLLELRRQPEYCPPSVTMSRIILEPVPTSAANRVRKERCAPDSEWLRRLNVM